MAVPPFSEERLTRPGAMEGWHFWFVGRRTLLDRLVASSGITADAVILDVGCGTGLTTQMMQDHKRHRARLRQRRRQRRG